MLKLNKRNILQVREEKGCSLREAKRYLIKINLKSEIDSAETIDELKPLIIKLVNLAL